jgi:phosphoglycerate dehydrogenase-like enzyme
MPLTALLDIRAGVRLRAILDRVVDQAGPGELRIIDCGRDATSLAFDEHLAEAGAVLHVLHPFTRTDVERAPRLRLVQKLGVGVNTIDLEAAKERGVAVCNQPGVNASAVVEAALLGMLAALRQLPKYQDATRSGRGWTLPPSVGEDSRELGGRTVGLIGFGSIASKLSGILVALGAHVIHHSRRSDRPGWRPLDELIAVSDVVSLHVPLDASTAGMLTAARLAAMKPGSVLVNTARGGLVDQDGLISALLNGPLSAAALDTFAVEPVHLADPLLALPNVVLTPHTAWLTLETLERCVERAAVNLARLHRGEDLLDRVV